MSAFIRSFGTIIRRLRRASYSARGLPSSAGQNSGPQTVLKSGDSIRISDFAASGAVGHIERIDRCPFLRANARENNVCPFASERREQIVKKPHAIGRFDLNQRVDRVRFVVDRDSGWKFQLVQSLIMNLAPGL